MSTEFIREYVSSHIRKHNQMDGQYPFYDSFGKIYLTKTKPFILTTHL